MLLCKAVVFNNVYPSIESKLRDMSTAPTVRQHEKRGIWGVILCQTILVFCLQIVVTVSGGDPATWYFDAGESLLELNKCICLNCFTRWIKCRLVNNGYLCGNTTTGSVTWYETSSLTSTCGMQLFLTRNLMKETWGWWTTFVKQSCISDGFPKDCSVFFRRTVHGQNHPPPPDIISPDTIPRTNPPPGT